MANQDLPDALRLADEGETENFVTGEWTILVVDDEPDVHSVTNLVLQYESIRGRKIRLLHAYSGKQAIEILEQEQDIALILLDVVMDTDDDGLRVANYVRQNSNHPHTRIIMRTGQPGAISEHLAAKDYHVDYYEPKAQMTAERMLAVVHMALDGYESAITLSHTVNTLKTALDDLALFSSAVAHDIKSPARQMAVLADMLVEELPADTMNEPRELATKIGNAGRELLHMIDQLLELSQLGKDSLNISAISAKDLIESSLKNSSVSTLDISIDIDPEITIDVDHEKFRHVITNLIENASKYRSKERPLQIALSVKLKNKTCQIEVSDNGVGINESALNTVFLPFRRANTDDSIEGTGIGLALCKRIISLHEGTISISSVEGSGTTIRIALPAS